MKKQSLIRNLVVLAVVLAMIMIVLILLLLPGPIRTVLVPPTPTPSPTATPVHVELLSKVVVPRNYPPIAFHFAVEPSGDPPYTELLTLVTYGEESAAKLQVNSESAQVVIGSSITIYGDWKGEREWEEVRTRLFDPDGIILESYDYLYEDGLPRRPISLSYDIPMGSTIGTYSAMFEWNEGTNTFFKTTYSFEVTQPYAPFVHVDCLNAETYLFGFEPGEEVRLAVYDFDGYDAGTETATYALHGDWTVTVGSDGMLHGFFPEDIIIDEIHSILILAIGESRPVIMTDTAGNTLMVSAYETGSCPVAEE